MKIAILLRGHIQRTRSVNSIFKNEFIFTKTYDSYIQYMIEPMKQCGYNYDIYASIKGEDNNLVENFVKMYNVKEYKLNKDTTQFDDILEGLKMISKETYDLIVITRVDLLYKINFDKMEYDKDKFNFCWMEPIDHWTCDIFYIFSSKYLKDIIKIYEDNKDKFCEQYFGQCIISNIIIDTLGIENINFLFKEKYYSGTHWNIEYCNNPLYIIYGYDYYFGNIY